jgi:hypothetical protein
MDPTQPDDLDFRDILEKPGEAVDPEAPRKGERRRRGVSKATMDKVAFLAGKRKNRKRIEGPTVPRDRLAVAAAITSVVIGLTGVLLLAVACLSVRFVPQVFVTKVDTYVEVLDELGHLLRIDTSTRYVASTAALACLCFGMICGALGMRLGRKRHSTARSRVAKWAARVAAPGVLAGGLLFVLLWAQLWFQIDPSDMGFGGPDSGVTGPARGVPSGTGER